MLSLTTIDATLDKGSARLMTRLRVLQRPIRGVFHYADAVYQIVIGFYNLLVDAVTIRRLERLRR